MKKQIIFSLLLLFSAFAAFAGGGNIRRADRPVPYRYLVLLADDFPATKHAAALASQVGGRLVHVYERVLNGFSIYANEHVAVALAHNPAVAEVHEVGRIYGGETQSYPPQGLDRIDQTLLDLDNAFVHNNDGEGVYIYIVDSGVNPIADLAGRVVENRSFLTQNGTPVSATNDCYGHGTAVASVAAGTTYGVAKAAWIVNLRVLDCNGMGSWDDFARALDHIAGVKATTGRNIVANASLFGSLWMPADDAVRRLVAANVPIALISGNDTEEFIDASCRANAGHCSPGRVGAGLAGAMTTGATEPTTDYVTDYTIQGSVIDIFAPSNTLGVWGDGNVYLLVGTSFAAPHVAGVMAKHLQRNPLLSAAQIEASLRAQASTASNVFLPEVVRGRTFRSPDRLLYSLFRRHLVHADFNRDSLGDLVWEKRSATPGNAFWFTDLTNVPIGTPAYTGNASFPASPAGWHIVGTGDFNVDWKEDLLLHNAATGQVAIWYMNGSSYQSSTVLASLAPPAWTAASVADFDHNGSDDIAWRNTNTGENAVWLMNGAAVANVVSMTANADLSWHIVGAGHFNADDSLDLVWQNDAGDAAAIWIMNGTTYSHSVLLPATGDANWRIEAVGDFDRDGNADLVWRNHVTGANAVWLMNGTAYVTSVSLPTVADPGWYIVGPR